MTDWIPGQCDADDCPNRATSFVGWWDGGAPSVGEWHEVARCDYHLGDPPGAIPGRCWTCGHPISADQPRDFIIDDQPEQVRYHHIACPPPPADWIPKPCCKCDHPIGHGQPFESITQPFPPNRIIYWHTACTP